MEETSEQKLLISMVLLTLQRKCLKLWEVWASGSEVRLDDERMPNIPHEFMTLNPTSNQAEETREPLEQVLFYTEFVSFF
jgi:hypothetical protein